MVHVFFPSLVSAGSASKVNCGPTLLAQFLLLRWLTLVIVVTRPLFFGGAWLGRGFLDFAMLGHASNWPPDHNMHRNS
jgi:hypothetical protein